MYRILSTAALCLWLAGCGSKNPNHWFNSAGEDCGAGLPYVGCDFHSSGNKITLQEDPYYSATAVSGLTQWTSTDGILYQINSSDSFLSFSYNLIFFTFVIYFNWLLVFHSFCQLNFY